MALQVSISIELKASNLLAKISDTALLKDFPGAEKILGKMGNLTLADSNFQSWYKKKTKLFERRLRQAEYE